MDNGHVPEAYGPIPNTCNPGGEAIVSFVISSSSNSSDSILAVQSVSDNEYFQPLSSGSHSQGPGKWLPGNGSIATTFTNFLFSLHL